MLASIKEPPNRRSLQQELLLDPSDRQAWDELSRVLPTATPTAHRPAVHGHAKKPPADPGGPSSAGAHHPEATIERGVFQEPDLSAMAPEAVFRKAKEEVDGGQFEAAIALVEAWLNQASDGGNDAMLAFIRAHAYRQTGRVEMALTILQPFRQEASIPWIPFELGLIHKALGQADEAYLCFREAKGIQPDFTWATIEANRTTAEANVPLGRLDAITAQPAAGGAVVEVHLDRTLRCGSLLLLIGWCREAFASGSRFRLSDPLAPGAHAVGSATFYHRPDVCQALSLPEHQKHGFAALIDVSGFRRWSELGHLRLMVDPEGEEGTKATSVELCLAEVAEETSTPRFFEAVLGVFRVSIDSGNRWPESLRLFTAQAVLEVSAQFARHVAEERHDVEVHWLTRTPMATPPLASVIFVQLGSFLAAKPAILQLAKTGLPLELIVVNNSPELFSETFHILDRFADIRPGLRIGILNRGLNLGFSAGCNLGAEHASGECLIFHNNDLFADSVDDYKLLITRALREPNVIHSAYQYFTDGTLMQEGLTATRLTTAKAEAIPLFNGFSVGRNQTRADVIACSGSLMAISKPLFRHLDGFSEEIVYAHFEDFDLCLRARQEGIPVQVWDDIRFFHAEGTGSMAPYHLSGTTSHINRLLFSLKWRNVLEGMDLPVEYSL
jgi:GT2 family glycosyltransferase/tetratricopeptide (TPR) repeat protein